MTTVQLNTLQVLALSGFGVAIGHYLKKLIPVLDRLNVPHSVVGGLMYSLIILALRDRVVNFEMDLSLRSTLMVAFFTTVGMGASLRLLKVGGKAMLFFFGISTLGILVQNGFGIALCQMMGLNPLVGIITGSVALTGGPATALAFGRTFEEWGVENATVLGVASAMAGIVAGGLIGGYVGGKLIENRKLRVPKKAGDSASESFTEDDVSKLIPGAADGKPLNDSIMVSAIAIAVAMGIGTLISLAITKGSAALGYPLILPEYIGAMLAAALIRNIDDATNFLRLSQERVDELGNVALNVFIVMALLTLELWKLFELALPILIIIAVQLVLVFLMAKFLIFPAMGKDYEAAVSSGGFCGFMLGTTANALASMEVLTTKYGRAPRALIIVSITGAFLIDFTNAAFVTAMANWLR
jgi:ESS family glutamate:Na+ symporter